MGKELYKLDGSCRCQLVKMEIRVMEVLEMPCSRLLYE
jgi:hypothetical protein